MADWTQDSISVSLKDPLSPNRNEPEKAKSNWDIDDVRKPGEVLGTVKRNKIFMSRQIGEVEVVEFVGIDVDGAPVLEAFPSIGLVSVIVGKEAVKLLDLPLIGIVKSDLFATSAIISREQPSHAVRIYGNRRLVVFLSEMTSKIPDEAISSIVDCILDFAHRHKCPMIYSIEGVPKTEKITLPTGEEIELNLRQGGGGGGEEDEEGGGGAPQSDELPLVLDDTVLAKLTKREEAKAAKEKADNPEAKKEEEKKDETPKKKKAAVGKGKLNRSGSTPMAKKKGKGKDKEGEEEEEEDIETVAAELFGEKIHYVSTSIDMAKRLREMGHIPVVDGIIPGVTGGILANVPLTDEEVTAILCPASSIFPDPEAAVRVLKLLGTLIPDVDFKKGCESLEKEGEDLKKMMKSLLSGLDVSSLKKSGSVPYGMYQ